MSKLFPLPGYGLCLFLDDALSFDALKSLAVVLHVHISRSTSLQNPVDLSDLRSALLLVVLFDIFCVVVSQLQSAARLVLRFLVKLSVHLLLLLGGHVVFELGHHRRLRCLCLLLLVIVFVEQLPLLLLLLMYD